jgi:hypothetical protein
VNEKIDSGSYRFSAHANERLQQREVTRLEVKQALKRGYHEKRKDSFDEQYQCWNYSIRGKTLDQRVLRVVVSFNEANMLIITVIDLDK